MFVIPSEYTQILLSHFAAACIGQKGDRSADVTPVHLDPTPSVPSMVVSCSAATTKTSKAKALPNVDVLGFL